MKKIFILSCLAILLSGATVLAQGGLGEAGSISGLSNTDIAKQKTVPTAVGYVLGQATFYLGILLFLLVVYAGFMWMTASGNEEKISKAKGMLFTVSTGLVIVLSAYAIVRFVFGNLVTGTGCEALKGECMTLSACKEQGRESQASTDNNNVLCPSDKNFQCCLPK